MRFPWKPYPDDGCEPAIQVASMGYLKTLEITADRWAVNIPGAVEEGTAKGWVDAKLQAESAYRRLTATPTPEEHAFYAALCDLEEEALKNADTPLTPDPEPETPENGQRIEKKGISRRWDLSVLPRGLTKEEWLDLRERADEAFGVDPWGEGFPVEDATELVDLLVQIGSRFTVASVDEGIWCEDDGRELDTPIRWWPLPTRKGVEG